MQIDRIPAAQVPWSELNRFQDRNIFQTAEWLKFVHETQRAEPVFAALRENASVVGYFSGMLVKKFGLRILASPMKGWNTPFMGFNLLPGTSRAEALVALREFAFRELRCIHMELTDRGGSPSDAASAGFRFGTAATYQSDLT